MPDWIRDVLIALGAFVGGRAVNGVAEQMKEGRELRRGVDRLTTAVEGVSSDLRDIRAEIHGQVAGLKVEIHDQVNGLRQELQGHKMQQEARFGAIEDRVDTTAGRIDALSAGAGFATGPLISPAARARLRLNQEMGCYQPAGEDTTGA